MEVRGGARVYHTVVLTRVSKTPTLSRREVVNRVQCLEEDVVEEELCTAPRATSCLGQDVCSVVRGLAATKGLAKSV